jgi:hypothetical protein
MGADYPMVDLVHLICDSGTGDLAWAEIASAFTANLPPNVRLHMTSVKSFDTISTGFAVGQVGLAPTKLRPSNMVIFANTAPRKDRSDPKVNNEGEGLVYAKLKNGVHVVAVNSGFSLSFIRDDIAELWSTDALEEGSQFRSRDFFPRIVHSVVAEDFSFMKTRLDAEVLIPLPPPSAVAYIDSFGNLKTTVRSGDDIVNSIPAGTRLKVRIGNVIRAATVATGSFNVLEGDLAFAPGSSGYERRYWELFTRGASAWDEFGHPTNGSKIFIEKTL